MLTILEKTVLFFTLLLSLNSIFAMSFEDAKKKAHLEGKNIFINYSADWCLPCQIFEEQTLSSSEVATILKNDFISIKADYDNIEDKGLFDKNQVLCLPTIHLADDQGTILSELNGTMTKATLLAHLEPFRKKSKMEVLEDVKFVPPAPIVSKMTKVHLPKDEGSYTIQLGAFRSLKNAENYGSDVAKKVNTEIRIVYDPERNLFLINTANFYFKEEYSELITNLRKTNIEHFIKRNRS